MKYVNPAYKPATRTRKRYRCIYGGAGSGKSVFVAQNMIGLADENPDVRVLVLRKVARTCRQSTFLLIRDMLRETNRADVHINRTEMTFGFPSGGEILHAGLDDVQKLKSISGVTHIWVEEATELDFPHSENEEPDLAQIDLRLRGVDPALCPSITLTFNPIKAARDIFDYLDIDTEQLPSRDWMETGDVYVQHTTHKDNPMVGPDYTNVFSRLGGSMQAAYERGELVMVDEPDQVIPYAYVKRAQEIEPEDGLQYMGVDVARFGNDDTVLSYIEGNALRDLEHISGENTQSVAATVATRINERSINASHVGVDAVGIGAGAVDALRDVHGLRVVEIVSGGKPVKPKETRNADNEMRFRNLRSQMWWVLRTALEENRMALPYCTQRLAEDLCAPRYRIASDKVVEVEPKRGTSNWGIQQRIGRSPDDGDATVYGWALTELMLDSTDPIVWA
jgi:hypothetical protein